MSRISSTKERGDRDSAATKSSSGGSPVVVHVPIATVPTSQETVEIAGGESSEGEGDVEIENDEAAAGEGGDSHADQDPEAGESPRPHRIGASYTIDYGGSSPGAGGPANLAQSSSNIRHISKRTVITRHQKVILEEFYRCGMTSASLQVHHLHVAASEKTGLDINVVKNWVRNRKRPRMSEKNLEKTGHAESERGVSNFSIPLSMAPVVSGIPSLISTTTLPARNSINEVVPDPKRVCLEHVTVRQQPSPQVHPAQTPLPPSPSSLPLVVRVRVSGSGEEDFVEAEVTSLTYHALLSACCQELEVGPSDVVKIRKLPNIWVRKDRDVQRMREGQELEVVLKSDVVTSVTTPSIPLTSVLTVNPFSSTNTIPVFSLQASSGGRPGEIDHSNLIAALTTEGQTLSELTPSSHVNGL